MKQEGHILRLYSTAPEIRYVVLPLVALWLSLCTLAAALLTPDEIIVLCRENGLIENITAGFYALAALLGAVGFIRQPTLGRGLFFILMMCAGARELDLHKRFTHDSILKIEYYIVPGASASEKIISAVFVILVICCCIRALLMIPRLPGLVARNRATIFALPALAFLALGKMIDSGGRLLPSVRGFFHEHSTVLMQLEETAELGSSLLFLCMAAGSLWAKYKNISFKLLT